MQRLAGCCLFLLVASQAFGAATSQKLAGAGADNSGVGTISWTNPSNVGSSTNWAVASGAGNSHYLIASTFGFTSSDVPVGSSIDGITVLIDKQKTGTACFVSGTLIDTPEGPRKIETLKNGDAIYEYDRIVGEITGIREDHAEEVVTIVAGGRMVRTTPEHPFFLSDSTLIKAGAIRLNNVLLVKGKPEKVTDFRHTKGHFKVWVLSVDGPHTFFANGFAVHNKGATSWCELGVQLAYNGTLLGTNQGYQAQSGCVTSEDDWSGNNSSYGGAANTWGATLSSGSGNDVTNSLFQVYIWGSDGSGSSFTLQAKNVRMTINYTAPTPTPAPTPTAAPPGHKSLQMTGMGQ